MTFNINPKKNTTITGIFFYKAEHATDLIDIYNKRDILNTIDDQNTPTNEQDDAFEDFRKELNKTDGRILRYRYEDGGKYSNLNEKYGDKYSPENNSPSKKGLKIDSNFISKKAKDGTDIVGTDGWYYVVQIIKTELGNSKYYCAVLDRFNIMYPTFEGIRATVNNMREGNVCGGGQISLERDVDNIKEKDIYGNDLNYKYDWYFLSGDNISKGLDKINNFPDHTEKRDTNIICNVSPYKTYYPSFLHIKQMITETNNGITHTDCPYPWNTDTLIIKKFIEDNEIEDRVEKMQKPDFLSSLYNGKVNYRMDSLFVPITKNLVPKISFNIGDKDGNILSPIMGKNYNENVNKIICTEAPTYYIDTNYYNDTNYTYTICDPLNDTLFLVLKGEGETDLVSIYNDSEVSTSSLFYKNKTPIDKAELEQKILDNNRVKDTVYLYTIPPNTIT